MSPRERVRDQAVLVPVGARAGWAPTERRVVVMFLLPDRREVGFSLTPEAAARLAAQLEAVGRDALEGPADDPAGGPN